jgi:aspartyl/asparaginyl beta-hydroxylase (cupin superfamily)
MPWVSDQNEQVLVLRMTPGTDVERHSGPSNSILNVHLGIQGLEGARLMVDGKEYGWEEGKVIAWDGSYDHTVDCLNCKEDRIIIMVRYMHPDVTAESYRGNKRTHFEEIDPAIFES